MHETTIFLLKLLSQIYVIFFLFKFCNAQNDINVNLNKFTPDNGLVNTNVKKIIKDNFGFVYVATQGGVDRYDGIAHTHYKVNAIANKKILSPDVRAFYLDSTKNKLWVLQTENGFSIIDTKTTNVISEVKYPKSDVNEWSLNWLFVGNRILITTSISVKVYNISTNKFEENLFIDVFPNAKKLDRIETIIQDSRGNILVFLGAQGVLIFSKELKLIHSLSAKELQLGETVRYFDALFLNNQDLLIATDLGLHKIKLSQSYTISEVRTYFNTESITSLCKQTDGTVFIGSSNSFRLFDFNSNTCNKFIDNDIVENDWLSKINTIFKDKQNLVWLGTKYGIASFSIKPAFEKVFKLGLEKLDHLKSILHTNNNLTYAGTFGGFAIISKNLIKNTNPQKEFDGVFQLENKEIIVSRIDQLFLLKNNKLIAIEKSYPEFSQFKNCRINSLKKINESIYVLGTENELGILLWNINLHSIQQINKNSIPLSIEANVVNTIYINANKELNVLSDKIISVIDLKAFTSKTVKLIYKKNTLGLFFDMAETNKYYWIASYGNGLIQTDKNFKVVKIFGEQDGLCDAGVYKTLKYGEKIFITTNNGLSVFDTKSLKFKNYYTGDGLHGNVFEEAVGCISDSLIYAGGINGYTVINPKLLNEKADIPKLYFQAIYIETKDIKLDTTNLGLTFLSIPNNYAQVKINFIGLNLQNAYRVNYYYKIKELENSWIDLKNQNFVTLIGLTPGKYTLQIKAANEDGIESEVRELQLHFLPKWYQTLLFKILTGLLIAGLLFVLYTFRIKQLKKVIAVRHKISQNLHDDIGSTLSAINMYTQVAKLQPQQNEFLNSIETNTQDVLSKLDDIIWSTNPKNDKFSNLIDRMETFAFPLCKAKNVSFLLDSNSALQEIKIAEVIRQNVFLMYKEAVNNALKYSDCTQINVAIGIKNKHLHCTITDNGKGFDTNIPTERNGLLNMQQRAKELKGTCNIISKINEGTTVAIQFPI